MRLRRWVIFTAFLEIGIDSVLLEVKNGFWPIDGYMMKYRKKESGFVPISA